MKGALSLPLVAALVVVGCSRAPDRHPRPQTAATPADATPFVSLPGEPSTAAPPATGAPDTAAGEAPSPEARTRTITFGEDRSAMLVLPHSLDHPSRLLVMIHGVCTPVSYVCGAWKGAAADNGLLICPVGNTTCGSEGTGPPSWEEPFSAIDDDVEASIKAAAGHAPRFGREGSVLMGFSRGGYAAVILAVRHPGRWPLLIVNEADVELTLPMARAAGIRAVALIAGEWGNQLDGERKTAEALAAEGVPARLWTMPKAGHFYSTDIEVIMKEALEFVVAHEHDG